MAYTTDALISDIKVMGMIPTASTAALTDADILVHMNNELNNYVVPLVLKVREEFYVRTEDVEITTGTMRYTIPARALGSKLRDLYEVTKKSDGTDLDRISMMRIEPENIAFFNYNFQGYRRAFYVENNDIVFLNQPTQSGRYMRLVYFLRHPELVLTTRCGQITAVSGSDVTVSTLPANITASTLVDFVHAKPHLDVLAYDRAISSINGTTITFSVAPPSGLAVGDYISLAGESPAVILPVEVLPLFKHRVCMEILKTLGDVEGALVMEKKLPDLESSAMHIMDNRIHGKLHKIVNQNSIFNAGRRFFGRNVF